MRLLLIGNIPVDLVLRVPALPVPGDDVRADSAVLRPGGALHVALAAWQGGLPSCYAGAHGEGPYGDVVRRALREIGASTIQAPRRDRDTGLVLVLVDASGERSFVTAPDAVVPYAEDFLRDLRPSPGDLAYVSGYVLGLGVSSLPLAHWVAGLPGGVPVFVDLGPWGVAAAPEVLGPVLGRVDWLSCNAREAGLLTGAADASSACAQLGRRTTSAGVLLRSGAQGCWLALPGGQPELIPARSSETAAGTRIDTTGAGDTHSGAFLAAVAAGRDPRDAVVAANEAAARQVSRESVGE